MYQTGSQAAAGGSARHGAVPAHLKRLMDYAVGNPAKTLSLMVLSYGGLLLLVYFGHISFLPDVNLEALASVLYAVALLGLLLAGYTATTLVLPGMLLGGLRDEKKVTDRQIWWVVALSTGVWALIVLVLQFDWGRWGWLPVGSIALIVLVGAAAQVHREGLGAFRVERFWVVWLTALCSLLMAVPMAMLVALGLHGDLARAEAWQSGFALALMAVGIALTALLVATTAKPQRWKLAMLLAPLALLVFLMLTGSFSAISVIAVHKLGLGEYHFVRAVVSGRTCKQINQVLGQAVCDPQAEDDAATAICPVVLRSRIGSQVVLEFAALTLEPSDGGRSARLEWATPANQVVAAKAGPLFRRVVLPKEQLLTWSGLAQLTTPAAASPASHALASWLPAARGGAAQPEALNDALARVCGDATSAFAVVPMPAEGASSAATVASVRIDAKGSASHQTVINVQLQNGASRDAVLQSSQVARGSARPGAAGVRAVGAPGACAMPMRRGPCCQRPCCGPSAGADEAVSGPSCAASSVD